MIEKQNDVVVWWLNEIDAAKKREKDFRKEGERVIGIYSGKKPEETPFNIVYSNTETLLPAIYSQVPRPVVSRRFKDADPIGKYAAKAATRMLEFLLDTNIDGYETFDDGMKRATLDGLLPGRGVTCVKYDAEIVESDTPDTEDTAEDDSEDATEPQQFKEGELVCLDSMEWNRVYIGYAKKWSTVPWIAYELHIDKSEAKRLFGRKASSLKFTVQEEKDDDGKDDEKNKGEKKTACIYQIWDRDGGKKIRYLSPQYKENFLKVENDPLQLTGFFNCPKPLQFLEKNDLLPVALYMLYENQAKELNELTRRITLIVRAIKAKAVYDSALGEDVKNLVEAEDNELVPTESASALATEKGMQNAFFFWPIDALANTLQVLLGAREQCKQVIYEVTGISDILRGSTVASETATAQKIKSQWGSLRLKRLQKEVQRYARDLLRMMLEVAATKFSEETWSKMTGLPFLTTEKVTQLQQVAMMAQMSGQPLDPQTQAALQMPQWGQVLPLLQNDLQRAYRIDIETNSTVEAEATEDKEQMAEVMAAVGQALNGLTPLVTAGTLPFEAAQAMLLTIVRRFRFGSDVEDMIMAMKQPTPPDQAKQQADAQMQQMQQQMAQRDQQAQQAVAQAKQQATDAQAQLSKSQYEKDVMQRETALALKEEKLKNEEAVFRLEKQYAERMIAEKATTESVKLDHKQKVATMQNSQFKTENVVNKKADSVIGDSVKGLQGTVEQLVSMNTQLLQAVAQQSQASQAQTETLAKAITAPRKKTAVRGKDGKIEAVTEEVA